MNDEAVPFDDRGFAYGDGLFETVLVRDGRPMLWEEHLARLSLGCQRLAIPCPARVALDALPSQAGAGLHVLKLVVTRGSGGRGYLPPATAEPRLRWRTMPFMPREDYWRDGVRVRLCELRLASQPRLAGLKHLNRLENVLARQEWRDESVAEGVLCDSEGHLVEATGMNLFWLRDGQLETPRLDRCGVAGTLRAALLNSQPIRQVSRSITELQQAQALWLGNSVQGLWPVTSLVDAAGRIIKQWAPEPIDHPLHRTANELLGYPRLDR